MSNTQVGNVYQQIIADVVESSRVDFEEGGVDEGVLEELRLVSLLFPLLRCCVHQWYQILSFIIFLASFCSIFGV
jgi:transcription initiation factor TFIIA large subunit